jgi:hypothetical protein
MNMNELEYLGMKKISESLINAGYLLTRVKDMNELTVGSLSALNEAIVILAKVCKVFESQLGDYEDYL